MWSLNFILSKWIYLSEHNNLIVFCGVQRSLEANRVQFCKVCSVCLKTTLIALINSYFVKGIHCHIWKSFQVRTEHLLYNVTLNVRVLKLGKKWLSLLASWFYFPQSWLPNWNRQCWVIPVHRCSHRGNLWLVQSLCLFTRWKQCFINWFDFAQSR